MGRRKGKLIKVCPVCKQIFFVPPSLSEIKHCSRKCYLKSEDHKLLMEKLHRDPSILKKKAEKMKKFHRQNPEIARKAGKKGYAVVVEKYPDFLQRAIEGYRRWAQEHPNLVREKGKKGYQAAVKKYPNLAQIGGKASHQKHPNLGKENMRKTHQKFPPKKAWEKALESLRRKGTFYFQYAAKKAVEARRKKGFPNIRAQIGRKSSIECILQKELKKNNIFFEEQFPIEGICVADIAFPERKIAVFCDGDYWHNLPHVKERDKKINKKLVACGWQVLRFWEHEIKTNVEACVSKIISSSAG